MEHAQLCLIHAFDSGNAIDYSISEPFSHPEYLLPTREISFRCRYDNEGTAFQIAFKSWFNFSLVTISSSPISEQLITFRWTNPPPTKKLIMNGYRPIYRFLDAQYKPLFIKLMEKQAQGEIDYDTILPSHKEVPFKQVESRCSAVLNGSSSGGDSNSQALLFTVRVQKGMHILQICHSYPYPLNELYARFDALSKQWFLEMSVLHGQARLYKICKGDGYRQKPIIYISARCHPGETPGSYILDGILDSLDLLLDTFQVWIVPAINAEGVRSGNYRADLKGNNLNRCYNRAEYPDLVTASILKLVSRRMCNPGYRPDVYESLKSVLDTLLKTKYFEQMHTFSGSSDLDECAGLDDDGAPVSFSKPQKFPATLKHKRRTSTLNIMSGSDIETSSMTSSDVEGTPRSTSMPSSELGVVTNTGIAFEIPLSEERIRSTNRCNKPSRSAGSKFARSEPSDRNTHGISIRKQKYGNPKLPPPAMNNKLEAARKSQYRVSKSSGANSNRLSTGPSMTSLTSKSSSPASVSVASCSSYKSRDAERDRADCTYPAHALTESSQPLSYNSEPRIVFCLDIHAHASIPDCFLFGNSVFESGLPGISKDKLFLGQLRNILFTSYLGSLDPIFNITKCDFKPDSMTKMDRAGNTFEYTMRVGLYAETMLPTVYCFESHYYRRTRDFTKKNLSAQDFIAMGTNLARAIRDYYEFSPDKALLYIKRLENNVHLGYSAQKLLSELRRATNGEHITMLYKGIYDQLDYQLNGKLRRARNGCT